MNEALFSPPWCFGSVPSPYSNWETARVVVLPVPYDSTVDWRSGTREGPRAIIEASRFFEKYDIELDTEIYKVGIHTLPELRPQTDRPESMAESVRQAAEYVIDNGKMLLMLGGEHSITLGAVQAYHEKYPDLSVLQLDAHADMPDKYKGSRFSHATVMRRTHELCPVVPVGIRSMSAEEREFIESSAIKPFYADGLVLDDNTTDKIIAPLSEHVYVTIDVDAFDPSIMSATGTPEPGGLEWYGVCRLLRKLAKSRKIVGFDIVELSPGDGPPACAYLAAKLAYKIVGYIWAKPGKLATS